MKTQSRWHRAAGGVLAVVAGCGAMAATILLMNTQVDGPDESLTKVEAELQLPEQKKKKKAKITPRKKPKVRRTRTARAPRPSLATDLSSLGSGVALFEASQMSGLASEVLSDTDDADQMVMTGESVDTQPRPLQSNRAPTPPRAAQREKVSGFVVLRMLIDDQGQVRDVRVVESVPTGFFDDSILEVAPSWRFQPATYQGKAVSLRVDQTIRFNLG